MDNLLAILQLFLSKKLIPALSIGTATAIATYLIVNFTLDAIKNYPLLNQIAAVAGLSFFIAGGILGIWYLFSYVLYARKMWDIRIGQETGAYPRLPIRNDLNVSLPDNRNYLASPRRPRLLTLLLVALTVAAIISSLLLYTHQIIRIIVPFPGGIVPTTSTIAAIPYPYNHAHGTFAVGYLLNQPSKSVWQTTAHCQFMKQAYYVRSSTTNAIACTGPRFADSALQVKMTILAGDCGGVIFRENSTHSKYYFYRLCQDKRYQLLRVNGGISININHPWLNDNVDIHAGLNRTNLIGIIAQGNKIWLYVNKVQISCITDNGFANGVLSLAASSNEDSQVTEVAYNDLRIWTLRSGGDETCK